MVLFGIPRCRDEFCTHLAHYSVRGFGFAVEGGMLFFISWKRVSLQNFNGLKFVALSKWSMFSALLSHKDTLSVTGSKRSSTLTFVRLATRMLFVSTRVGTIPHRPKV
jgi:hypothetical protein